MTFKDGLSPLQETPILNKVFRDDTVEMYLAKISDIITLHIQPLVPIKKETFKHYDEVFANFVVALQDRGLDHIDTWIEMDDVKGQRFAEHFGFMETGFMKLVRLGETEYKMLEMRCPFGEAN